MNIKRIALAPVPLVLLGGCAAYMSQEVGRIDPEDFGEANRQTYAAMIVNPDPQYDEPMTTSAEHASDAVEAYRSGDVKEPEQIRASEGADSR